MVKGISRQVIVVHAPEPAMFEQTIFIIKDGALKQNGVTDEALVKEANKLLSASAGRKKPRLLLYGPVWALGGALLTGAAWLLSMLI